MTSAPQSRLERIIAKLIEARALIEAPERGNVMVDYAGTAVSVKVTVVLPPDEQKANAG